ncbi:MAG: hypothetical protein BMS9Abin01_1880 [Gammaproteobacteria bacterium]|nr:MAG: hypothetical protein BMS9Abin01_1880 [Gammaproteobacteria bacterium]
MSDSLNCWKCGHALDDMPMPLRRRDECPACGVDLHVCRMCEFYATSVAKSCREPVAEEVTDKERANFCDYFCAQPGVHAAGGVGEAEAARTQLEAMFGVESKAGDQSAGGGAETLMDRKRAQAEEARKQLDALFGNDKKVP